jgi:hypothetical protein
MQLWQVRRQGDRRTGLALLADGTEKGGDKADGDADRRLRDIEIKSDSCPTHARSSRGSPQVLDPGAVVRAVFSECPA